MKSNIHCLSGQDQVSLLAELDPSDQLVKLWQSRVDPEGNVQNTWSLIIVTLDELEALWDLLSDNIDDYGQLTEYTEGTYVH